MKFSAAKDADKIPEQYVVIKIIAHVDPGNYVAYGSHHYHKTDRTVNHFFPTYDVSKHLNNGNNAT